MVCPHCQTRGHVRTTQTKVKKGISGGKATGAVLTAGLSVLATGLSRKEKVTKATCGNCNSSWQL
jgi:transcription elongation factor Elf1